MDKKTILDIDSQEARRHARSRILEQGGFKVLEATTGGEGLQLIAWKRPTLVVLQGTLHDLSLAELCRRIKMDIARSALIIHITATGSGEPGPPLESADIYLREPLAAEELIATVTTLTHLPTAATAQVSLERAGAPLHADEISPHRVIEGISYTFTRDICDCKRLERVFATLVEHVPDLIFRLDRELRYCYVNPAIARLLDRTPEQCLGKTGYELGFNQEICEPFKARCQEVLAQGQERQLEFGHAGRFYRCRLVPERARDDSIESILGITEDITEQKIAAEALRASEERLRFTLACAQAGSWEWDIQTDQVIWSKEMYTLYGLDPSRERLTYADWFQTLHPDDQARIDKQLRRVLRGRPTPPYAEFRIIHPKLGVRWLATHGTVQVNAQGIPVRMGGIDLDITARRQAEEALRLSEERFRTWLKMTGSVFCTANPEGAVIEPQPYYQAFTGLTAAECQGQGWLQGIHPDDRERVLAAAQQGIKKQQPFECELRFWHAASRQYRWMLERIIPQFDAAGSLRGWVGAGIDIQALKAAEIALQKADRCKDEFLAILAHELRNPLAPIRNAVRILREPDSPEPRLQWAYGVIERQVNHLARLVEDLLDVSRLAQGKITLHPEQVDIVTVVEQALELSRPLIHSRGHALSVALPIEPLPVRGDVIRLAQVIQNLLNNAAKYTPEGGKIRLEARRENDQVVILVRDTGKGISMELLPHIFDLFRQGEGDLERQQGGLGIGLTLVKRLIDLHGGQVEARSDGVGQGSEFIVRLPLSAALPPDNQIIAVKEEPRTGKTLWRILVVDDHVDFAESMAVLLECEGHEARLALDGPTALELAIEFQPEVILLDLGLPGMDGYAVARQLRARPETRNAILIAVTGHGQPEDRVCTQAAGFDYHLVKPIAWEQLNRLLIPCQ